MTTMVKKAEGAPGPYPGEFIRGVIGSTIHGLSVAATDDLDLMGVCIESPRSALTTRFEQHVFRTQPEGHPSGPGDVDLTTYTLRKYMRLAMAGNPTVINLLFVPSEWLYVWSSAAEQLQAMTPKIISRAVAPRYLGYMRSQHERLIGERGQKRTGYTRRLKYMSEEQGFDTKYAMHLCRLGVQGIELLRTGKITLPMAEGPERSTLMDIRLGRIPLEDVVEWATELEATLTVLRSASPLPPEPDHDTVWNTVVDMYRDAWGW